MQNELSGETVHAQELGGKISLVMDGNQQVLSLEISQELCVHESKEKLERGLKNLFNESVKKIQRQVAQKMLKDKKINLNDLLKS